MSAFRRVKKIFTARPTLEGAGVKLKRAFGFREAPLFDPFLMLDDFGSANPADYMAGFPWHPHRGIETVTYVLQGAVDHGDSMGNAGSIGPGQVQWMTAGRGIIHQEMPRSEPGVLRGLQLWVNLPREHKMTAPRYRDITAESIPAVRTAEGGIVKVIAGRFGDAEGPVKEIFGNPSYLRRRAAGGGVDRKNAGKPPNCFCVRYGRERGFRAGRGERHPRPDRPLPPRAGAARGGRSAGGPLRPGFRASLGRADRLARADRHEHPGRIGSGLPRIRERNVPEAILAQFRGGPFGVPARQRFGSPRYDRRFARRCEGGCGLASPHAAEGAIQSPPSKAG